MSNTKASTGILAVLSGIDYVELLHETQAHNSMPENLIFTFNKPEIFKLL